MTVSEIMEKMITFSNGNIHDIDHLIRVWTYAKTIGELERLDSQTQFILEIAAITHDIACPLCREKYGNTNGKHQEAEGVPTVAGKLVPNSDAPVVKEIFERYVRGQNYTEIARALNEKGIKTLRGSEFSFEAIRYIISNETYVGDKHLMKQPPTDYLTHKPDKNTEYKDYYLTDDHPAIVERSVWNAAQARVHREAEERENGIMRGGDHHFLYGRVFCGECGSPYKRRTVTGGGQHYKMWNCRERQKGKSGNGCKCRNVKEEDLIAEICNMLRWAVDEDRMAAEIQRVDVYDDRVEVTGAAEKTA